MILSVGVSQHSVNGPQAIAQGLPYPTLFDKCVGSLTPSIERRETRPTVDFFLFETILYFKIGQVYAAIVLAPL